MNKLTKIILIIFILLLGTATIVDATDNAIDYSYYILNDEVVLTKYNGTETDVVVPSEIDGYPVVSTEKVFFENETLESVTFQNGIESIGANCFSNCVNLKKVKLPKSVKRLESFSFSNCAIEKITLPKNLTYVGQSCFWDCSNLDFVKVKAKEIFLDEFAFANTNIKVIQVENRPTYYNNTFPDDACITYNPIMSAICRYGVLSSFISYLNNIDSTVLRAALKTTLALFMAVFIVIIFVLFGWALRWIYFAFAYPSKSKNSTAYKKYNTSFNEKFINNEFQNSVIAYNKPILLRDKIKRWALIFLALLYIFMILIFVAYFNEIFEIHKIWENVVCVFLVLAVPILMTIAVSKTRGYICEKYDLIEHSSIRIIKTNRRNKND